MEIVAAVRDAVGPDMQIMIEMHGRFTASTAAPVASAARTISIPNGSKNPSRRKTPGAGARASRDAICRSPPVSVRTRWRTCAGFIEDGLVDVVQVDLTHFGGFLR